jgi:hypothetical protein
MRWPACSDRTAARTIDARAGILTEACALPTNGRLVPFTNAGRKRWIARQVSSLVPAWLNTFSHSERYPAWPIPNLWSPEVHQADQHDPQIAQVSERRVIV